MELFGGVLAAILIAILISALFYYALKVQGPWGSFWTFFLVILLPVWAASLWIDPVGPVYWSVAWVPLFFVGLLFAMLLAAIPSSFGSPSNTKKETDTSKSAKQDVSGSDKITRTTATVSGIFWLFMLILLIIIIAGYSL